MYQDILLHLNTAALSAQELVRQFPPVQERRSISDEVWVGRLDNALAKTVLDLCEPRSIGIGTPPRQYGHLYAFVRDVAEESAVWRWDEDHRLSPVVALSRLIHPTTLGYRYAARIRLDERGETVQDYPAEISGIGREAWLSPYRQRDWLVPDDVELLRELATVQPSSIPTRVSNALWYLDYAFRTYYLDLRWTLICTGLEALLHTDINRSMREFTVRIPSVAVDLGIQFTADQGKQAFQLRSTLAHGESFLHMGGSVPNPQHIVLYDQIEDILRAAILRAFRDANYARIFTDPQQIRSRWPI